MISGSSPNAHNPIVEHVAIEERAEVRTRSHLEASPYEPAVLEGYSLNEEEALSLAASGSPLLKFP